MLIQSHFIATTLMANALSLNQKELVLAYIFGVMIDFDHLLWSENRKEMFYKGAWRGRSENNLHTIVHEPIFGIVVFLISILFSSFIPLIFWFLHILLDTLVISHKQPLRPFKSKTYKYGILPAATRLEWITSSAGVVILALSGFIFKL